MKKVKKIKKKGVRYYDKKLWTLFSRFIRIRDCIDGDYEKCRCFTCGIIMPYKKMQAGHYIPRQFKLTRFDERNNNAQCYACNMLYGGNIAEYGERLGKELSKELLELQRKYKAEGCESMDVDWYKEKIEEYTKKLEDTQLINEDYLSKVTIEDLPF